MRLRHLFIPILIVLTFSSCDLLNNLFKKTGTVSIALQDGMSRSLDPAISMSITKYVVTGTGPEGASFTATETAAGTVTKSGVAVGDWTVVANGYNASDVLIGTVTQAGTVTQNNTTSMTLRVVQLAGSGVLDLSVSWPVEAGIMFPAADGILNPESGSAIPLTLGITANTAAFSGSIPAGFYSMALRLRGAGAVKWNTEPINVRIAANGVVTTGAYALSMGDLTLDFTEDFNDMIAQGWAFDSSTWNLADNKLQMTGINTNDWHFGYFAANKFSGDFTYQATISDLSATSYARGLFFNVQDGAHPETDGYRFCVCSGATPSYWVGKYVAGVPYWTSWILNPSITAQSVLKIARAGIEMKIYIDGNLISTWTDASFTSGYAGIALGDMGQVDTVDDISWQSGTPAPSPSMSRSTFPPMRPFVAGENSKMITR